MLSKDNESFLKVLEVSLLVIEVKIYLGSNLVSKLFHSMNDVSNPRFGGTY
jgi:hypothetical protein